MGKAKMPLISRKKCADMNNRNSPNKIIGDTMLCAGQGPGSIVSGCQGDSGGPLVCIGRNKNLDDQTYVLTGAVRWGVQFKGEIHRVRKNIPLSTLDQEDNAGE